MTEILFYHLTESTLEDSLPALLEKSHERGWQAVVQTGTPERCDTIDAHLWTYRDDTFLAHGTGRDGFHADQPVFLTTSQENPNHAAIRFLVDGASPPDLTGYERAVFLFDGHDETQLAGAREQWRAAKLAGHDVTYWQQTPERRWERKA